MVKRERGFTLVELLIALALSMIGLLGLMALQISAIKGNASSRNFAEATALAQEKLEKLQVVPYANVAASTETALGANPASTQTPYTRTVTIISDNGTTKVIEVEVSWPDEYVANKTRRVRVRQARSL
jgi:prepilin-type N-terminal cleavage/methylation domain-containing protein